MQRWSVSGEEGGRSCWGGWGRALPKNFSCLRPGRLLRQSTRQGPAGGGRFGAVWWGTEGGSPGSPWKALRTAVVGPGRVGHWPAPVCGGWQYRPGPRLVSVLVSRSGDRGAKRSESREGNSATWEAGRERTAEKGRARQASARGAAVPGPRCGVSRADFGATYLPDWQSACWAW